MKVTVAICTWNRARILERTLDSVSRLIIPEGQSWEVVVVDNNSKDDTQAVLQKYQARFPLRPCFEPSQGIAYARNHAVAAACCDLLLFLDDDCVVEPDWVSQYVAAARAWPDAAVFGGPIEPEFETPPARWMVANPDLLRDVFGFLDRGPTVRRLSHTESVLSANMAIRMSCLSGARFDVRLGRVANGRVGAEEIMFFADLMASGATGVWVGGAKVKHWVAKSNMTEDFAWRTCKGNGQAAVRLGQLSDCALLFGLPRWTLRRYVIATTRRVLLSGIRNAAWGAAFREAAVARGMLDEFRNARLATATECA